MRRSCTVKLDCFHESNRSITSIFIFLYSRFYSERVFFQCKLISLVRSLLHDLRDSVVSEVFGPSCKLFTASYTNSIFLLKDFPLKNPWRSRKHLKANENKHSFARHEYYDKGLI